MPSESLGYFDSYEKYRFLLRQRVELPKFFKLAIPPPLILNGPGEDEDEADMRIIRRGRIREKCSKVLMQALQTALVKVKHCPQLKTTT